MALVARGELARALENQLASEQRGDEPVLIGLTFKARDGDYCRSFVLRAAQTAGLACRAGAEWQIPATDSSPMPQGRDAAGGLGDCRRRSCGPSKRACDGAALDAEAEKSAQLSGWDPEAAESLEEIERIDVERPAQVARRLERLPRAAATP